jgi:hypothetical protein
MRNNLIGTFRELSRNLAQLFDSYRPELHYMRGPGPKWYAKRTGNGANAMPVPAQAEMAFGAIVKARV